jgi:predicted outer membrane protein
MKSISYRLVTRLALAVVLLAATATAEAADQQPPPPSVVVRVEGGGFHWLDAAVGSVATLAAGLLVFGLVMTVRAERRRA